MIDIYESNIIDLVIVYDDFICDENYRKKILTKLSCYKYDEVKEVTKDGWGSSFSQYKLDTNEQLTSRKCYLNQDEKESIKNDKRIYNFYNKFKMITKKKFK